MIGNQCVCQGSCLLIVLIFPQSNHMDIDLLQSASLGFWTTPPPLCLYGCLFMLHPLGDVASLTPEQADQEIKKKKKRDRFHHCT